VLFRSPSGILRQAAFLSTGKVEGLTLDATYGMKDASAGHLIFCLSGGQHPSCTKQIFNLDEDARLQSGILHVIPSVNVIRDSKYLLYRIKP
jgi:hypothetical protein